MMGQTFFCVTWGDLEPGETRHDSCEVVIKRDNPGASAVRSVREGPLPVVCECECLTCKRAWWKAGRPRHIDEPAGYLVHNPAVMFEGFDPAPVLAHPASFSWAEIAQARLYVLTNPISHIEKAPAPGVDGVRTICGAAPEHYGGPASSTCLDCLIRCARGEE